MGVRAGVEGDVSLTDRLVGCCGGNDARSLSLLMVCFLVSGITSVMNVHTLLLAILASL